MADPKPPGRAYARLGAGAVVVTGALCVVGALLTHRDPTPGQMASSATGSLLPSTPPATEATVPKETPSRSTFADAGSLVTPARAAAATPTSNVKTPPPPTGKAARVREAQPPGEKPPGVIDYGDRQ
jgi:hypothetical protein